MDLQFTNFGFKTCDSGVQKIPAPKNINSIRHIRAKSTVSQESKAVPLASTFEDQKLKIIDDITKYKMI